MRGPLGAITVALAVAACAAPGDDLPPVIAAAESERDAPAVDRFEVWVCHVPVDTTDPLYATEPGRLDSTPAELTARFAARVSAYWQAVSHGQYRPVLSPGGEVAIAADDPSAACVDRSVDAASDDADAVLVIADAQHAADQPGGRSSPAGWSNCSDSCSARDTGRHVYVGANDFFVAADAMPFDLLEHEIGHSLGLPHSGDAEYTADNEAAGPYDVMGDPSSPRRADPSRRDAPDLIAIDRLQLGWLPIGAVHVADASGDRVDLAPSTGTSGTRMLVVPVIEHQALTVELLTDSGFDDHLPASGVVVHVVDDSPASCGSVTRCGALDRRQLIVGMAGSGNALLRAGDAIEHTGWKVTVESITAERATVVVSPVRG